MGEPLAHEQRNLRIDFICNSSDTQNWLYNGIQFVYIYKVLFNFCWMSNKSQPIVVIEKIQ